MKPVPQRSGATGQRAPLRLLSVFFLLLGTLMTVSIAATPTPAQAATLTVTATSTGRWNANEGDMKTNTHPVTVSGTTVNAAKSIRISFPGASFDLTTGDQFNVGQCPVGLTATIGQSAAECYVSAMAAMVSLTLPNLAEIAAGTAFSLEYAVGIIDANNPVAGALRTVTVGTYDGNHHSSTLVDSGTATLGWPVTVTFDGNGADSGSMADVTSDVAAPLPLNAFVKAGFTFDGWARFCGACGKTYDDGETYPFFPANETLYARWVAPSQTVTFDGNGADSGSMTPQSASSSTQLSPNVFTRAEHTFLGWNTDPSASSPTFGPFASYDFSADITLYAIWEMIQYTVTFDSNGGTPSTPPPTTFTSGGSFSAPTADPTRDGFTFEGWSTVKDDAATKVTFPHAPQQAANLTLYALWEAAPSGTGGSTNTGTNTGAVVVPNPTPTTTEPAPVGVGESDLITEQRQEQLTAPAGDAKLLIGGELVDVTLTQASSDLRAVAPAERTAAQVTELQTLAASIVAELQAVLGVNAALPISVRNTPTGAVIVGLARNPITGEPMDIPVEDVILVSGGGLVLMASGVDGERAARIGLDGALEIPEGGHVSVIAGGLTPGAQGEVVVMSTPRLISDFAVGTAGEIAEQAALPTDLPLGDHTVVVTVGDEAASLGFRLVAATAPTGGSAISPALPATGSDGLAGSWALLFLALGALTLLVSTRRRVV